MKSKIFGNFMVSLPFLTYGGPLSLEKQFLDPLLQEAAHLAEGRKVQFIEVRQSLPPKEDWTAKSHKVTFLLDLPQDRDLLWKNLKDKVRNQVRKGEKRGCQFRIGHEHLNEFYQVFAQNMRNLGTPVYGKIFFENVLRTFPKESQVFLVQWNGKAVAAAFTLGYRDRLEIPWAASLYRYHRLNATMFLYWNVIQWASENDFKVFDFGRCSPEGGAYHFKKQWGGREIPLAWSYYLVGGKKTLPEISPRNPKYRFAIALWKRLPLWFTNWLGPKIVRNIP